MTNDFKNCPLPITGNMSLSSLAQNDPASLGWIYSDPSLSLGLAVIRATESESTMGQTTGT